MKKIAIFILIGIYLGVFAQNIIADTDKNYVFSSFKILDTNHFNTHIELSNSQPYGKAYYTNNGTKDVSLYVKGQGTVTVKPNKSEGITWKKSFFKKYYKVDIHCSSENLNGLFSLAGSDKEF